MSHLIWIYWQLLAQLSIKFSRILHRTLFRTLLCISDSGIRFRWTVNSVPGYIAAVQCSKEVIPLTCLRVITHVFVSQIIVKIIAILAAIKMKRITTTTTATTTSIIERTNLNMILIWYQPMMKRILCHIFSFTPSAHSKVLWPWQPVSLTSPLLSARPVSLQRSVRNTFSLRRIWRKFSVKRINNYVLHTF